VAALASPAVVTVIGLLVKLDKEHAAARIGIENDPTGFQAIYPKALEGRLRLR